MNNCSNSTMTEGKITKNSQCNIFWSSSESDQDEIVSETPTKERRLSIGNSSSDRSELFEDEQTVRTVAISPVLNSNWERDSPVLNSQLRIDMSPILTNKHKKFRKKVESNKLDLMHLYCTPDLFHSQTSQIIEYGIQDASQKLCKIKQDLIEATQTVPTQSSVVIEPVFSQNASIVAEFNSANSNEMTGSSNTGSSPYIPRKRKKYKTDSVSKRVYNMIQSQSFRYSVWQINKQNTVANDDICIKCSIEKKWKDYGTTILECCVLGNCSDFTENTILICLSPVVNITLEIGSICVFYSPFIEKIIFYHDQDVRCYINVIKIHQVKMIT